MLPELPTELWVHIFEYATHVPGTLVPDIYAYASGVGSDYAKKPLREALVTKRALVGVCKQWWHLAIPILYRSVYIGAVRTLSDTLVSSVTGTGILATKRPLGEYTQRLDIAIRDCYQAHSDECNSLDALITCMPHLAVVSLSTSDYHGPFYFADTAVDALRRSAASLRVLDWSASPPKSSPQCDIMDLLNKCTQLRVLNCPYLKDLEHGGVLLTVTTLRLWTSIHPVYLLHFDPNAHRRSGPSALRELILDVFWGFHHWEDMLRVYSSQLVSAHFIIPSDPVFLRSHFDVLAVSCPALPRLTTTVDLASFILRLIVFPSITYLGLRATQSKSPQQAFEKLFMFLENLRSTVPSLRVVQLLNEEHVQCLFRIHTQFAVQRLQPFMDASPFRVEDKEGVLLTNRPKALGHM